MIQTAPIAFGAIVVLNRAKVHDMPWRQQITRDLIGVQTQEPPMTPHGKLFDVADKVPQACLLLGVDVMRVLVRAGLPADFLDTDNTRVDSIRFFALWEALRAEYAKPDFEMVLAMNYAHGPFAPPIFAFSCADTVGLGLLRLSKFKELLVPFRLAIIPQGDTTEVRFGPLPPAGHVPASIGLFEILYIVECARTFTATHIVPDQVHLSDASVVSDEACAYLGCPVTVGADTVMVLSQEVTDCRQITRSASLWDSLEPALLSELQSRQTPSGLIERVTHILEECLPAGITSAGDVASRMYLSKRSLQRRLKEEGTTFQDVLNQTRSTLARQYLVHSTLSVPEISHMLGFQSVSSFFRNFQTWEDMAPGEYREAAKGSGSS